MDPDRFLKDPKLYSNQPYRPFGGGHSLCPGRFFAKRSIAYVVAAMLTRFDMGVDVERTRECVGVRSLHASRHADGKTGDGNGIESINFPRVDASKPSPGASLPAVQGDDVFLVLREKKLQSAG